jgi:hypothetical protein
MFRPFATFPVVPVFVAIPEFINLSRPTRAEISWENKLQITATSLCQRIAPKSISKN